MAQERRRQECADRVPEDVLADLRTPDDEALHETAAQRSAVHEWEYVVVGSGAGGGTLAARLAEAGRTVLLLEAGGDPRRLSGQRRRSARHQPPARRLRRARRSTRFASENDAMSWDFFVRHYADEAMQAKDPKYVRSYRGKPVDGVLYPRAGTLGGCTAHNAMILVYPHNADWDADRQAHRRPLLERGGDAAIFRCGSRTAITGRSSAHGQGRARTRRATAGTAGCTPRRPFPKPRSEISRWSRCCWTRPPRRSTRSASRSKSCST